jgi:hypothetical protein
VQHVDIMQQAWLQHWSIAAWQHDIPDKAICSFASSLQMVYPCCHL